MSFYSDSQSRNSGVPPSVQPYRSLFGGSSQATLGEDQVLRFNEDEALVQLDGAAVAGGSSFEYEESEDELDYEQTSNEETSISPRKTYTGTRTSSDTHTKPILKTRESSEIPTSPSSYRPNRFYGKPHLWLHLTKNDRDIAEALAETGARNLAAHLYNAHVLQSRGIAESGTLSTGQSDEDQANKDELSHEELLDILEEWTAWPMLSDEVPRSDERLRRLEDDRWTFRMKPDARPSAELEECITAFISKIAKERFQSREWAPLTSSDRKGVAPSDSEGAKSGTEGDIEADQRSVVDATHWKSDQNGLQRPLRPVVQIDDDESRRKLRPLARNVITQFEILLMGLHRFHGASQSDDGRSNRSRSRSRRRARSFSSASDMSNAYPRSIQTQDDSEAEHHADIDSTHRRSSSSSKKRLQRKTERSYSRGRMRTRRTSQSSQQNGTSAESTHTSSQRARSTSANTHSHTRLTDWRDVAGVASMIGLPPVVLRRATERFSAIVGEDMEFPSFLQNPTLDSTNDASEWTSTKFEMDLDESPSRSALASRANSTRNRSNSPPDLNSAEGTLPSWDNSTKRNYSLICPFKKCRRHEKGFSRRWNLNQHLKTMHPSYRPKDKSQTRSAVRSEYSSGRFD
ncbi:RNA polymerase I-specific transcription initiation factor-domain-containing protein [Aspergillus desertorum]